MSDNQNNQHDKCKCGNLKQVVELQKKIRELHKIVHEKIPKLEHEISTLRKAVRK